MKKKIFIGLAVFLVVVIAAGAISYFSGVFRAPELKGVTLSWGTVSSENTVINAAIKIDNRLPFGVQANDVGVHMPIYIYDIEAADIDIPNLNLPKGESSLTASATMIQANLPQWWPEYIQQGEQLSIDIKPTVNAKIMGISVSKDISEINTKVPIPIMENLKSNQAMIVGFDNSSILDIVRSPNTYIVVGSTVPRPIITMESWELHWGNVNQQQTQVLGTVILKNETSSPIPIQGLRVGVDMNKIQMIPDVDITPSRSELPPGQSVSLTIQAAIDNNKLVQWWTSHLEAGEKTAINFRLGLTVVLPASSEWGFSQNIQLPIQAVPLFEYDIQTHIMDVANYQIAKMLGQPLGPEPKAFEGKINTQSASNAPSIIASQTPSAIPSPIMPSISITPPPTTTPTQLPSTTPPTNLPTISPPPTTIIPTPTLPNFP